MRLLGEWQKGKNGGAKTIGEKTKKEKKKNKKQPSWGASLESF
jgi:hypothetical protein